MGSTTTTRPPPKLAPARARETSKPGAQGATEEQAIRKAVSSDQLFKVYSKLDENFKSTLRSTLVGAAEHATAGSTLKVSDSVTVITKELARRDDVLRVGILDLGAWIGGLPTLIEKLNTAQPIFTLFEILAPIPSGLLKTPEGFAKWTSSHSVPLSKKQRNDLVPQIIADDFFRAGNDIREAMGLDLLVGVTPAMVAGSNDDGIYWNHFSSVSGKTILISTADLRDYAEKAERTFEAAVGVLLVAALLVSINDDLGYHADTGCLFDYNESRVSLIETVRAMHIEKACLDKMSAEQSAAAVAMLSALKRMKKRKPK